MASHPIRLQDLPHLGERTRLNEEFLLPHLQFVVQQFAQQLDGKILLRQVAFSPEPSHVVKAMKPNSTASRQMIRFSLGTENKKAEIQEPMTAIQRATARLKS